jgi:hypothetical protein
MLRTKMRPVEPASGKATLVFLYHVYRQAILKTASHGPSKTAITPEFCHLNPRASQQHAAGHCCTRVLSDMRLELTDEEEVALLKELNQIIENDRYPLSQRIPKIGVGSPLPAVPLLASFGPLQPAKNLPLTWRAIELVSI